MSKFDVLITDNIDDDGVKILEDSGIINVDIRNGIKNEDLKPIIGNYDAIITRSGTTVTEDLISNPGKLKVIGRAGVGLDNVDIEAASKKGIIVMNAPTGNTLAATELTMAMMLSAARKVPSANASLKSGKWDRKAFMGMQLYHKTLGIVGLGRIGGNVAQRAKAFGMNIIAFDPYIKKTRAESLGVELYDTLDELLAKVDIITFHTPLTKETHNMITEEHINKMKDGVIVINCARGGIINENDLYNAAKSGKIASVGIDVFEKEPATDNKLLELDNIYVTPHIGANTSEGQKGVATIIAEQIVNTLSGKSYMNAVNIPFMKSQLSPEFQRYFELIEKMSKLAGQIVKGRPEKIEITMVGKNFEEDACEMSFDTPFNYQPFTIAAIKGFLEISQKEAISYINAPYFAKDRNIDVKESKTQHFDKYNDLMILSIKTDTSNLFIAGTVFNDNVGRIVVIDKFYTDMIPQGTFLYFRNDDQPGFIGKVGTILGKNNINIAGFELSRQDDGGAMAFVSVDQEIDKVLLEKILDINGIIEAQVVSL